jgi:hypothetical protein
MKTFKWHGIPVNLPDTRTEWLALKAILGLAAVVNIVVIVLLALK